MTGRIEVKNASKGKRTTVETVRGTMPTSQAVADLLVDGEMIGTVTATRVDKNGKPKLSNWLGVGRRSILELSTSDSEEPQILGVSRRYKLKKALEVDAIERYKNKQV